VRFSDDSRPSPLKDLRPYVDRARRVVVSTNRQLQLECGRGFVVVNAPAVQGFSGDLRAAGPLEFSDVIIDAPMAPAHLIVVSLDDKPLTTSSKMLLQVVTEEKSPDPSAPPSSEDPRRLGSHGPWLMRDAEGLVRFKRPDAAGLKTSALDPNGDRLSTVSTGADVRLSRSVVSYLIEATRNVGKR
jgi:hypothetical protein